MWPGRAVTDDCRVKADCLCQSGIQGELCLLVRLMQIESSSTMRPCSCGVPGNFSHSSLTAPLNCFCGNSNHIQGHSLPDTCSVGFLRYEQVTWTGLLFEPSIHPFICSKGKLCYR